MKYRIVETEGGRFYPQFKEGWFGAWHGFKRHADLASHPTLTRLLQEDDPALAARFQTKQDADRFVEAIRQASADGWQRYDASRARAAAGIKAKRVTMVQGK